MVNNLPTPASPRLRVSAPPRESIPAMGLNESIVEDAALEWLGGHKSSQERIAARWGGKASDEHRRI